MELFRKLASNIFFKFILGIVMLSFVIFGISGFLLGNQNNWVAKVGDTTITYSSFLSRMKGDREIILSNNKSAEALKYVDSSAFKSDVLKRMVNHVMIEKLREHYQVEANRKAILQSVVKDPSFKNKEGKFDQALFEQFLAKHSLNEEKYVNEIANEITATMIIQSLVVSAPLNLQTVLDQENFKQEKRVADVITLTTNNISLESKPTKEDLQKFFDGKKEKYFAPETRKIAYFSFAKNDFAASFKISDEEIRAEYEKNKDKFLTPETRSFYHLVFDKKEEAQEFANSLSQKDLKADFAKQAKAKKKKDLKAIALKNLAKKDFIPELAQTVFSLQLNKLSDPIESPLGFHIFLVNEINPAKPLSFEQSKDSIKISLMNSREEKVLQNKISQIDDALVSANSLHDVAKKFVPLAKFSTVEIDQTGRNHKGEITHEIKEFPQFTGNAFVLKKGQNSKIYYSENFDKFYVMRVEEIVPAHQKDFQEVKNEVEKDFVNYSKVLLLADLAKKLGNEIKSNPQKAAEIAAKYKVKIEKDREFSRAEPLNIEGQLIDYRSKFIDELFALKIGEASNFVDMQNQSFSAAILRKIKAENLSSNQYEQAKNSAVQQFRNEIMQEFDKYLSEKHKVRINEKLFTQNQE